MPDIPNPIAAIGGALGNAAANAASSAVDDVGQRVWQFAITLLAGSFNLLDRYAAPDVDPVAGPLAGLLPTMLWIGAVTAFLLALLQLGKAMAAGGKGLGRLLIGLAQYAFITAGGLTFVALLVKASDGLATALLASGLQVDTFSALADQNTFWQKTAEASGGLAMGLVALLCVVPAAFMLLVEALIRYAAILVLAATVPVLAAGLVMESTARWFWTGLRWMVALLLLTPAVALVMVIGLRGAQGSVGQLSNGDPASATVGMAVGGLTMLVALLCPLALFKLLAFLDPNTMSGGAVRGFMSGSQSSAAGSAPATAGAGGGEAATESRFGSQLAALTGAGGAVATASSERGGQILDTAGVGHQGVSTGSSNNNARSSTSDDAAGGGDTWGSGPLDENPAGGPDGSSPSSPSFNRPAPTTTAPAAAGQTPAAGASGAGAAGAAETAAEVAVVAL